MWQNSCSDLNVTPDEFSYRSAVYKSKVLMQQRELAMPWSPEKRHAESSWDSFAGRWCRMCLRFQPVKPWSMKSCLQFGCATSQGVKVYCWLFNIKRSADMCWTQRSFSKVHWPPGCGFCLVKSYQSLSSHMLIHANEELLQTDALIINDTWF